MDQHQKKVTTVKKKNHGEDNNIVTTQTQKVFFLVKIKIELLTKHNIYKWFRSIMSHISSHFTVSISGLDSFMVYISKKFSENTFENILRML